MKKWLLSVKEKLLAGESISQKRMPKDVVEYLDEYRGTGYKKQTMQLAHNVAALVVEAVIKNPESVKNHVELLQKLLGNDMVNFSTVSMKKSVVMEIKKKIEQPLYEHYPYIVLARYVPENHRNELVDAVIAYADNDESKMSWAMTGEACETLGFLNQKSEESIQCLGRHLNQGHCDGFPVDNALKAMGVFHGVADAVATELIEFIESSFDDVGESMFYSNQLMKVVTSASLAKKLLPVVEKLLYKYDYLERISNPFDYAYTRALLALYGQINLLAKTRR